MLVVGSVLNAHRLLAAHRHRSEPAVAIIFFAMYQSVELLLNLLGNRPHSALADLDLIHGADGSDLSRGTGEKDFVGNVEHLARNHLLDNRDIQITRDLENRIPSDSGQHGVAERRGNQLVAMYQKYVFA